MTYQPGKCLGVETLMTFSKVGFFLYFYLKFRIEFFQNPKFLNRRFRVYDYEKATNAIKVLTIRLFNKLVIQYRSKKWNSL